MHLATLSLSELGLSRLAVADAALRESRFVPALVLLSELAYEDRVGKSEGLITTQYRRRLRVDSRGFVQRAVAALHCGSPGRHFRFVSLR